MKKHLALLIAITLLFTLAGCSSKEPPAGESKPTPAEEKTTDKLVVYSPNSEGLIKATIPLFEKKYNVKVELIQAGTGELIKRLDSEKSDPYGDVLFGGALSQFSSNAGLFEKYVSPNDKNVIEAYQNKSGYTTSYVLDGSVLVVNKKLKGDMKIASYEDLLNPALKGKIATADPASSSSAFAQLTNILLAKGGYDNQAAWDYVKNLFTNVNGKISSGSSAVYKSVADGEMVVGLSYEDPCAALVKNGAPVEVVYPTEGAVFLPATSGIVKGAKNIKNAKLFIDFIISEEVQNIYGSTLTNRPVIKNAKVGDYMTPMDKIKTINEDIEYVNKNKNTIVNKYKDIFTSISSK
jgi:iron(III) transport system substrate-binding protein